MNTVFTLQGLLSDLKRTRRLMTFVSEGTAALDKLDAKMAERGGLTPRDAEAAAEGRAIIAQTLGDALEGLDRALALATELEGA